MPCGGIGPFSPTTKHATVPEKYIKVISKFKLVIVDRNLLPSGGKAQLVFLKCRAFTI